MLAILSAPGEDVENLLKGRLAGWVFLNLELFLDVLHHAEDIADRVGVTTNFKCVRVAVMLNQWKLFKFALQMFYQALAAFFDMRPSKHFRYVEFSTLF